MHVTSAHGSTRDVELVAESYYHILGTDGTGGGGATKEASTETRASMAFYSLVTLFFLLFDRSFTERGAGYMDVPTVLKDTEAAFKALLEAASASTSASDLLQAHEMATRARSSAGIG
jgi:hypothetical protein